MSKTMLITGGAGFIGHHVIEWFLSNTDWNIICLDSFKHRGVYTRLDWLIDNYSLLPSKVTSRVKILRHDLNVPIDQFLASQIHERSNSYISLIINMASNSAIERSISDYRECWTNNTQCILNILDFALNEYRGGRLGLFIHTSTDEVYGECKLDQDPHVEWSVTKPRNPYSASKAAQESLCQSFASTFGLPIIITNTMNNFGERQDPEKFIPKIIGMISRNEEVQIYADRNNKIGSRFYLHCKDHAEAIYKIYQDFWYFDNYENLVYPIKFNIAGDQEVDNLELTTWIVDIMGKKLKYKVIKPDSMRPGYDSRYALDSTKLKDIWEPKLDLSGRLEQVVKFTLENSEWLG